MAVKRRVILRIATLLLAGTLTQWEATPAQAAPALKVLAFSQELGASSTLEVTNDCEAGWLPLSGTFSFASTDGTAEGVDVEESAPVFTLGGPPSAWTTVIENAASSIQTVSWSILCEQASGTVYSVVSGSRNVFPFTEPQLKVPCPTGSLAVSGGFALASVDSSEGVDVTSSAPWPTSGVPRAWRASFANEGVPTVQATVFAVCQVSPVPALSIKLARLTIPQASTVTARAVCPVGKLAIGGGFQFGTSGGTDEQTDVVHSASSAGITEWEASFKNNASTGGGYTGIGYADCR